MRLIQKTKLAAATLVAALVTATAPACGAPAQDQQTTTAPTGTEGRVTTLVAADGSVLISDDVGNAIHRVAIAR